MNTDDESRPKKKQSDNSANLQRLVASSNEWFSSRSLRSIWAGGEVSPSPFSFDAIPATRRLPPGTYSVRARSRSGRLVPSSSQLGSVRRGSHNHSQQSRADR